MTVKHYVFQPLSTSGILTLTLFVLGILTDHTDLSLALDDFALLANRFY